MRTGGACRLRHASLVWIWEDAGPVHCRSDRRRARIQGGRTLFPSGCRPGGARIPIHAPDRLLSEKPDVVLILPWNLRDEIVDQMSAVRGWGGKFAVAIPRLELV